MSDHGSDSDGENETGSGPKRWLLLEGNRLVVAAGVASLIAVVLLAVLQAYGLASLRPNSPMYFLFGSLLTGDLTLLTVVLSINQLVLSRELGTPGALRQRIDRAVDYRTAVEETTETAATPNAPPDFLQHLHESTASNANALEEQLSDVPDDELRSRMRSLVDSLRADVGTVNRALDDEPIQIFTVVAATLSTNHADQMHEIAEIRNEYAGTLTDRQQAALDRLENHLLQIDVARKYFKTIYVQKELAYLSRVLLYVGVPAIVASGIALVFFNAATATAVPGAVFFSVVIAAFVLGFAPLAILFAFVLRLAWVAQRTATVAPFSSGPGYRP